MLKKVSKAVEHWTGEGGLVLTSSMGVYNGTGKLSEEASTYSIGENERTDKMLKAEEIVLKVQS